MLLSIHFMKGPEYYATVAVIVYQSCIQNPFFICVSNCVWILQDPQVNITFSLFV